MNISGPTKEVSDLGFLNGVDIHKVYLCKSSDVKAVEAGLIQQRLQVLGERLRASLVAQEHTRLTLWVKEIKRRAVIHGVTAIRRW
jgi:hypothetical protein